MLMKGINTLQIIEKTEPCMLTTDAGTYGIAKKKRSNVFKCTATVNVEVLDGDEIAM